MPSEASVSLATGISLGGKMGPTNQWEPTRNVFPGANEMELRSGNAGVLLTL